MTRLIEYFKDIKSEWDIKQYSEPGLLPQVSC